MAPYLKDPGEYDEATVHALHATMVLLKNLYLYENQRWAGLRDRVCIGLVKDTKKYGNTSVSMGAAVMAKSEERVGFLNCGTGGIKYQLYSREGGLLHLVSEFKPKNGANPNSLKIGDYVPQTVVSFEATRTLLEEELANDELPWKGSQIPVFAFVTGSIRQVWEDAEPKKKARLCRCDIVFYIRQKIAKKKKKNLVGGDGN